jgi:hypothetical protein
VRVVVCPQITVCLGVWVLNSLLWASEYFIDISRRELLIGRLMQFLHRVLWIATTLQLIHSIDPFGTHNLLTHYGAAQWLSVNTGIVLIWCAGAYVLTVIQSVYSVLQDRAAPWVLTMTIRLCVLGVFITGNIGVCIVVFTSSSTCLSEF